MNIIDIKVPFGIKYISEWLDYELPKGHCIVDKGVTGCGYTEYCLTNSENVILCSPRKLLLENKRDQHKNDKNIFYLENEIKDYEGSKSLKDQVKDFIITCLPPGGKKVCTPKVLVTYDSCHYVIEALMELGLLQDFTFVVDEFQSIFLDSYFKASVEFDFVDYLQVCPNVLYLSATPMLEEYLKDVPEFMSLPFYKLDWSETGIVENIVIKRKFSKTLVGECRKIIQKYKSEEFEMIFTEEKKFAFSREAVFYFNSIGDITQVVKKEELKPEEVNIICADTQENKNKISKLSRELGYNTRKSEGFKIGKIPLKEEPNKMFTFCTKTAYIGADFYSDNASSFVFADPNISCLALDISLDLPQIVGRQRDRNNPFKNNITVFYRTIRKKEIIDKEAFDERQNQRDESTRVILDEFSKMSDKGKQEYLKKLKDGITVSQYSDDFVSISKKSGQPVYNRFIQLANKRAWDVSQKDYQDKISVTKVLEEVSSELGEYKDEIEKEVDEFLKEKFYSTGIFEKKLERYCEFMDQHKTNFSQEFQDLIYFKIKDERFRKYYNYFGTSRCRSLSFREVNLKSELSNFSKDHEIRISLRGKFDVGKSYTLKDIKFILGNLYRDLGVTRKPKATDLGEYYKLKRIKFYDSETKKRTEGYLILDYK